MMKYRMITKVLASALSIMIIVLAVPHTATAASGEKPRLNYSKRTLCVKKTYNLSRSFKLKVKGSNGKATFTTSNKKVAVVTKSGKVIAKKPGKAIVTVQIGGRKLKCRVTVKALSKFSKLLRNKTIKIRYKIKKNRTLNINVGQLSKYRNDEDLTRINNYFYETDNIFKLYLRGKISNRQKNKYLGIVEKYVKYKSSSPSVAKVTVSGRIVPKKAGSTTITVKLINKTFKIRVNVTKKKTTTYKGQKSLAVYSDCDVYKALKDAFYNHLIKGEKPEYKYLTCFYKVKPGNHLNKGTLQNNLRAYALGEYNSGNNFYAYITQGFFTGDFFYIDDNDNADMNEQLSNTVITVEMDPDILEYIKLTYTEAQEILRDSGINDCSNDYEKIKAMHLWFGDNTHYGASYTDCLEYNILVDRNGICTEYAYGTEYLCTLMNIPCDLVLSDDHMWNVCRIQGKWYYLDELHNVVLLGKNGLPDDEMYSVRDIANLNGRIKVEKNDFVYPEDEEPTEEPTEETMPVPTEPNTTEPTGENPA